MPGFNVADLVENGVHHPAAHYNRVDGYYEPSAVSSTIERRESELTDQTNGQRSSIEKLVESLLPYLESQIPNPVLPQHGNYVRPDARTIRNGSTKLDSTGGKRFACAHHDASKLRSRRQPTVSNYYTINSANNPYPFTQELVSNTELFQQMLQLPLRFLKQNSTNTVQGDIAFPFNGYLGSADNFFPLDCALAAKGQPYCHKEYPKPCYFRDGSPVETLFTNSTGKPEQNMAYRYGQIPLSDGPTQPGEISANRKVQSKGWWNVPTPNGRVPMHDLQKALLNQSMVIRSYCNPLFASSANANLCFPAEIPKPKRIRTAFSPQQLYQLESTFEKNHYVVGHERKELASNLGLTETQVKVWFQNRRTKFKRLRLDEDNDVLEITTGSPYNQDVGSASKTGSVTHSEEEVIMADEVLESSMNGLFKRTVNQSNCQTTDANSQLQAAEYEEQIHIKSNQNDHNVSRVG